MLKFGFGARVHIKGEWHPPYLLVMGYFDGRYQLRDRRDVAIEAGARELVIHIAGSCAICGKEKRS